jgi:Fur family iron response transcriptional regulator
MILGLKFMASTCGNSKNSAVIADCKCMSAERLRAAGLRPTRQRVALQEDASANGVSCSLATIYNTLHQFTDAGMLRVLSLDSNKTFFDTNVSDHHHFIVEGSDEVLDIKSGDINVVGLPDVPEGMEIANVDVIVRLRPIAK